MRVLLVHRYMPGHFGGIAEGLVAAGHDVVFLHELAGPVPSGVRAMTISPAREARATTHPYLQAVERAVLLGQATFLAVRRLVAQGFTPDVAYGHAGFGMVQYIKDALPRCPVLAFAEWYYRADGADADWLEEPSEDDRLRIRTINMTVTTELDAADHVVVPTQWQRSVFPRHVQSRIEVLHDGIDTARYCRGAVESGAVARLPIDLPVGARIVTYATRGLEPYRGFPQMIAALDILLRERSNVHAIIAGFDATFYGKPPVSGSWKDVALADHPELDRCRVHFVGSLDPDRYRDLLAASHAHVYLTVPFVLSWSLLEAMAMGTPLVASATPPVAEVLTDTVEALLVDLRRPAELARGIARVLDDPALAGRLGEAAAERVRREYARAALVPRHIALLERLFEAASPSGAAPIRIGATTSSRDIVGLQSDMWIRTA